MDIEPELIEEAKFGQIKQVELEPACIVPVNNLNPVERLKEALRKAAAKAYRTNQINLKMKDQDNSEITTSYHSSILINKIINWSLAGNSRTDI